MSEHIINVDDKTYDVDKLSAEAKALIGALVEADFKRESALKEISIMEAATIHLINQLKSNLTEEAIVAGEATQHEE